MRAPIPLRRSARLPWREAERIEVGGYPQAPTKEGSALSGLSRRTPARFAGGKGSGRGWGYPNAPTEEAAPSLDSPAGHPPASLAGSGVGGVGGTPMPPPKRLRSLWTLPPDTCPLRWREAEWEWEWEWEGLGVPQIAPAEEAALSLDSPAGHLPASLAGSGVGVGVGGVGGTPNAPAEEGCAVSGLSRRTPARFAGGKRAGGVGGTPMSPPKRLRPLDSPAGHPSASLAGRGAGGVGGIPNAPTNEGCAVSGLSRRAGSPSRGSGCDM